jgi:hypothetical protein
MEITPFWHNLMNDTHRRTGRHGRIVGKNIALIGFCFVFFWGSEIMTGLFFSFFFPLSKVALGSSMRVFFSSDGSSQGSFR